MGTFGVVLAGAAGVGKTRLATESLALAASSGFTALRRLGGLRRAALIFPA